MLLNILYYDQVQEARSAKKSDCLSFGPFCFNREQVCFFSWSSRFIVIEQIGIGLIVDVLIFIPTTLIVEFFRRIRQRRSSHEVSPVVQALSKLRPIQTLTTTVEKKKQKKKQRAVSFPWWCLFIAYGVSFVMIGVSILLIIARGIEFGDVKIQKWLTSLATAFFSSVLLSQPIKVCALYFLLNSIIVQLLIGHLSGILLCIHESKDR